MLPGGRAAAGGRALEKGLLLTPFSEPWSWRDPGAAPPGPKTDPAAGARDMSHTCLTLVLRCRAVQLAEVSGLRERQRAGLVGVTVLLS